jgi:hypothetical protein
MANLQDAFLGPRAAVVAEWIHSEENVSTTLAGLAEPGLKRRTGDVFGGENPLHGLAASVAADEHRDSVFGTVKGENVFRCGQKARPEWTRFRHACSRGAT